MSTSGSSNYSLTRNEIIAHALYKLGVYRPGSTVATADYNFCSTELNIMIKSWEAQGIHIWTTEEGALFITEGQNKYTLSSSTTDKIGKNPVITTLTDDASSTAITVDSTIGMTAADNLGIALDDGTIHWTTIVSVDSTTTLTLTAGPASTGSSGNSVFTYTSAVGRPLYIKSARLLQSGNVERPIKVAGTDEFMNMPNKATQGIINMIHYSPKTSTGLMYVWMTPSDVNECIRFTYVRTLEDFDTSTDEPDLPQEAFSALTSNLAVRVSGAYGKNINTKDPTLVKQAELDLLQLQFFDIEEGSVKIVRDEDYD